jgi:hypothetical protein
MNTIGKGIGKTGRDIKAGSAPGFNPPPNPINLINPIQMVPCFFPNPVNLVNPA